MQARRRKAHASPLERDSPEPSRDYRLSPETTVLQCDGEPVGSVLRELHDAATKQRELLTENAACVNASANRSASYGS